VIGAEGGEVMVEWGIVIVVIGVAGQETGESVES
jgi:hypothetical protein